MSLSKKNKITIRIIISIIALGLLVYLFKIVYHPGIQLPANFINSREQAALVSQKIVELTTRTANKISSLNVPSVASNPNEALLLIRDARETNSEAYNQAFELSQNLQKLGESLSQIKDTYSQQTAYEALATELSLVSQFIIYTQNLNSFLDKLSVFINAGSSANQMAVKDALAEVNDRANAINKLNQDFLSKMADFDNSL
ncbi:MAG: hypothetical protein AAB432_01470 [Patescibacteria group bacterium]